MELFSKKLPFKFPEKEGYSYSFNESSNTFDIKVPNGMFRYSPNFMNTKHSDHTLNYLLESNVDWKTTDWRGVSPESIEWKNINWRHDKVKMFGKIIPLPRYSAWYGDNDKPYTYSGLTLIPNSWNKGLLYLKQELEKISDTEYNSVLLNWYRDGNDHISWHTDAEPELGDNPTIGSINFGATRRFVLRRIDNKKEKIEFPLMHGTFLVMSGEAQHYWQHSVPKEKNIQDVRVNLTFREIKNGH